MVAPLKTHSLEKTEIIKICTKISGIGKKMAQQVLDRVGVTRDTPIVKVTASQLSQIESVIEQNYDTDATLRAITKQNISKLSSISSYRGWRHYTGLPCRGQRTHSNAKTCRKLKRKQ